MRTMSNQKQRDWWAAQESQGPLRCEYCGIEVSRTLPDAHPRKATIDHIRPRWKGGSCTYRFNLAVACFTCNQKKAGIEVENCKHCRGSGVVVPGMTII